MARTKDNGKLFYKIGEACKVLDIQPYVLRYWETEFPALAPSKSRSGQRVYSEKELAVIRRIKQLLYDEGYTIAGAKKKREAELAEDGELGWEGEETGEAEAAAAPAAGKAAAKPPGKAPGKPPGKAAGTAGDGGTGGAPAAAGGVAVVAADADERLGRLRAGVERALAEAREIEALLRR